MACSSRCTSTARASTATPTPPTRWWSPAGWTLRLSDIAVDRVPLDVGPDCHTRTPVTLRVIGLYNNTNPMDPASYNVFLGGPLNGTADIPAFTGCRHGSENLDPLMTA